MVEPVIPAAPTIENYPWPAIDAREVLRRLDEAENRLVEMARASNELADSATELSDDLVELVDDGMAKAGLAPSGLDYNDQCDLAFGRIRRLANEKPELIEHLGGLSSVDLGIDGLGLSGEQVQMVFDQIEALFGKKEGSAERALTKIAGHMLTPAEVELDPEDEAYAWSPAYKAIAQRLLAETAIEDEGDAPCKLDEAEASELDAILTGAGIEPRSTVEGVKGGDLVGRVLRLVASRARAVEQWEAAQGAKRNPDATGHVPSAE